ncbi:putative RNA helicase [Heterostelium album PN500]|uniref:ATP-dependent RNA helicase n=1 Tax=Heterostelium pallidum (strain ATCC 26659 / Pp 5 / PN500) TaxID=670386 RepID=D3BET6_HETP5|nr:putative RNA helicase [Heterostelium album PN500]EFA80417.1 putative RNA helicase [Heterostelium album PN500]|eukprot:XP_020432537.1 putative RNA helicase [Heterostelium album PN500]
MSAFEDLGVMPEIIQAVEELDWILPTPIQQDSIPLILGGGDVLAAAETGSGKTGAFALPILQITYETINKKAAVPIESAEQSDANDESTGGGVQQLAWSLEDRDKDLSIDGLVCQSRAADWSGGRATRGISKGKYYYEATVRDEGLCRVGWALKRSSRSIGTDKYSWGYGGTGKKSHEDLDEGSIGFTKNGNDFGEAYHLNTPKGAIFYPALLLKNAEISFSFTTMNRKPLSLIIEPVRELADQTYSAILNFSKYLTEPKIEAVLCLGGEKNNKDFRKQCDIVVGTPGILEKLVKEDQLDLSAIRFFVLDEADRLIKDNLPILNYIYNRLPKTGLQVLLFSATLHSDQVIRYAEQITKNPTWVDLKGKDFIPDLITHSYIKADPTKFEDWKDVNHRFTTDGIHNNDVKQSETKLKTDEQKSQAVKLLKPSLLVKCIRAFKMDQALIFARTRLDCDNLHRYLIEVGGGKSALENEFSSVCLHGDKGTALRKENLEKFKSGEVKYLICTDVASRGIDVQGLPFVINYTLPDTFEDYIHRVGRVGRADRIGLAISIVSPYQEKVWFHTCRDKGRGCYNTKLTQDGGCSVWYDEPELFKPIAETLSPMELDENFSLGGEVVNFGKFAKERASTVEYKAHTDQLAPRVIELARLEENIQIDFLSLPKKLANSNKAV